MINRKVAHIQLLHSHLVPICHILLFISINYSGKSACLLNINTKHLPSGASDNETSHRAALNMYTDSTKHHAVSCSTSRLSDLLFCLNTEKIMFSLLVLSKVSKQMVISSTMYFGCIRNVFFSRKQFPDRIINENEISFHKM